MARVVFGTRVRLRHNRKWLGFGLLLATTALVIAPRVEAAGEVTGREHPSYGPVWSIPALSADGTIWAGDVDSDGKIDVYRPDGYINMGGLGGGASHVYAMNGAGTVVVGASRGSDNEFRAFRWTELAECRIWVCFSLSATPAAMRMTYRAMARASSGGTNNWA